MTPAVVFSELQMVVTMALQDRPIPFADKLDNPIKIYAKYAKMTSDG